ncbi:MAG TPA: pseudouridine synthase [Candidatus Limnocylindria bacterium]|nr:pseudouridine synthase [Candidatus Limnocylindria bacterium]
MIRLQKVMAERGVASRRRAEELISEGRVRVDGELVTTLGTRVGEGARIEVDGRPVAPVHAHRYVLLNKPVGVVSTASDDRGRRTVVEHVGARERLFPVGRLDTDSGGLLLLTSDGAWAERVLHPRYGHEREYDVTVEGEVTEDGLQRLRRGVPLEEGPARAVRIAVRSRARGRARLAIVLLTGWKRQVRRMCAAVGLKVTRLTRVRMGSLELGRLRPGEFRDLTPREVDALARTPPPPARSDAVRTPRVPPRPGSPRARIQASRRTPIKSGWSKRRAAAPRAPARGGSPPRRGGVPREQRVSAPRRRAVDQRA